MSSLARLRAACAASAEFDTERLQALDHLGGDVAVNPHATERDTAIATVIDEAPLAVIAPGIAVLAGVSDMQLASAMATAQQAGEQSLAPAQRTAAHRVLAVGIVCDQAEVPFVVRPAQITLVVIRDQHLPVLALLLEAAHHLLAAGLDADAAAGAPEGIGAGIDRVGHDMQDRVVDWQLPLDQAAFDAISGGGQRDALVPEPEMHLTHRLHLGELGEDEADRLGNAPIRIFSMRLLPIRT